MATIIERYGQKFRRSGEIYERAKYIIPAGGHQARIVRPFPVYADEARGALKWDVDGNEIIDYVMGNGALILGNAHPAVTEAVGRRLSKGTHMGTPTELEVRWAELVASLIPSAERVRFTASGTESTLLAMRLARSFTGKTKVVKFENHFHGWHDYAASGSGIIAQLGIPQEALSTVVVLEPEIDAVERLLREDDDIAALILEPTGGHWGQFPLPNPGFLQGLRELTTRHGVVMIMDEVICGFRMSRGGAQGRYNVRPDLTTMAKIVSGGHPGGALVGKQEIMEQMGSPDGTQRFPHPGTYNGNPVSATAGITVLEKVANEPINERADAMAARLKRGLTDALTKQEVVGHVHGVASLVHVALSVECDCDGEICTLPHSQLDEATSKERIAHIKLAMLTEGVDMMGGLGFVVSAVHQEKDIDSTVEAFERVLPALRAERIV